jgi:hypothetical protein
VDELVQVEQQQAAADPVILLEAVAAVIQDYL